MLYANMGDLGRERTYMGFTFTNGVTNTNNVTPIDAIYLPTNFRRRDGYLDFLLELKQLARNIYIISDSNQAAHAQGYLKTLLDYATFIPDAYNNHHANILGLESGNNPSKTVTSKYDLPAKRNFAIEHARTNGHVEVMLLDDDIYIELQDVYNAICLLRQNNDLVGFYVLSFPDVSTIDHIKRMVTKKSSNVSVGGNCLLLNVNNISGFFPYIYNEDWLFIYVANRALKTACAGYARQLPHEPWSDHIRVKFEQFGDIIAKGIKHNLRHYSPPLSGNEAFWQYMLSEQVHELNYLSRMSVSMPCASSIIDCALHEISTFGAKDLKCFSDSYQEDLEKFENEKQ